MQVRGTAFSIAPPPGGWFWEAPLPGSEDTGRQPFPRDIFLGRPELGPKPDPPPQGAAHRGEIRMNIIGKGKLSGTKCLHLLFFLLVWPRSPKFPHDFRKYSEVRFFN